MFDNELKSNLGDLRSQVIREACITVTYITFEFENKVELFIEPMLTELMNLVPNSVKIMSTSGKIALKEIIQNCQSSRVLQKIIYFFNQSKSTTLRQFCCELVSVLCENWSVKLIEKNSVAISGIVTKGISDADEQARIFSRKSYCFLANRTTKLADQIFVALDGAKQKLLTAELKTVSDSMNLSDDKENISINSSVNKSKQTTKKSGSPPESRPKHLQESKPELKERNQTSSTNTINQLSAIKNTITYHAILKQLKSSYFTERLEGLDLIEKFMVSNILSPNEVSTLTDEFSNMFMETQPTVIIKHLSVLCVFIDRYHMSLSDWLSSLINRLLSVQGISHVQATHEIIKKILQLILRHWGSRLVFQECCKIVNVKHDELSTKFKTVLVDYLIQIVDEDKTGALTNFNPSLSNALDKIFNWLDDRKSQELRKLTTDLVRNIFVPDSNCTNDLFNILSEPTALRVRFLLTNGKNGNFTLKGMGKPETPIKYTPLKHRKSGTSLIYSSKRTEKNTESPRKGISLLGKVSHTKTADEIRKQTMMLQELAIKMSKSLAVSENEIPTKAEKSVCPSVLEPISPQSLEGIKPEYKPNTFNTSLDISDIQESDSEFSISYSHTDYQTNSKSELLSIVFSIIEKMENQTSPLTELVLLQNIIKTCDSTEAESQLSRLIPYLPKIIENELPNIRKQIIFCLAEFNVKLGEKFYSIVKLPLAKMKLIDLYTKELKKLRS